MSDELMLDSMGATPTGFEIKTHAGGPESAATLLFIADSIRSVLDGHDAPNYVEMEVKGTDGKGYILTLQRQGKVTPHKARLAAEGALARSVAEVAYQTARAEYFRYSPEIGDDPEGVLHLRDAMRTARAALQSLE